MSIKSTVSFSGYRHSKLPGSGNENDNGILTLKSDLHDTVVEAISHGFDTFLVGMAEGFDMFAAEAVIDVKQENRNIKLIAVVPYDNSGRHTDIFS